LIIPPSMQPANRRARLKHDSLDTAGCKRLAAAIIIQAADEAVHPDPDTYYPARAWLAQEGLIWIELLGFNAQAARSWLKSGCPLNTDVLFRDADDLYLELLLLSREVVSADKRKRRRRRA
jgi:hypothetical protein